MRKALLVVAVAALVLSPLAAHAQSASGNPPTSPGTGRPPAAFDITFSPDDAPHAVCPPFGPCPPASYITTEYIAFGVDFTQLPGRPPVGVFNDPPDQWAGINAAGDLDLLTEICGRIVAPGTTTQATTDLLAVSGGFVGGPADLLLETFDTAGMLVGSANGSDGLDPDGRHVATVDLAGSSVIASFCLSTPTMDTMGARRIYMNDPMPVVPITPAAALVLLALALAAVGAILLRRHLRSG